ncbi:hypothetical protein Q9L58_006394 [Maublancomyces gigas]|uniref:Uncharacterized protein n=1 Tax=Discina gigas TaxID=1032678 RepID=A0ABR3GFM1_9PEZI
MNDIPRGTSRINIINSLLLQTPANDRRGYPVAPEVQVGIMMADSRLDDELSIATIEFSDTPEWLQYLNNDTYGFPKKTAFGTLWRGIDMTAIDDLGQTAFMRAVIQGGLSLLEAEMMAEFEDTDVNIQDNHGRTALHWACAKDHFDMVRLCLSISQSIIGLRDNDGLTAFDVACQSGNDMIPTLFYKSMFEMEETHPQEALLRVLTLTSDPVVDRPIFPGSAMFKPVRDGNVPLIEALIARGVDHAARDEDGNTALHVAAKTGQVEIAAILLDGGFDFHAKENSGATPLDLAADTGNKDMEQALLTRMAWQNEGSNKAGTAKQLPQKHQKDPQVEPRDTSIHNEERPTLLGATKRNLEQTPIRRIERKNEQGLTQLLQAALDGDLDNLMALLQLGANVEAKNPDEHTPLHLAAKHGHLEIVKALIARGAEIEAVDELRASSLILAARNGHDEIVSELLDAGADIEQSNYWNQTALHVAADRGHTAVVTKLLAAGAGIEAVDAFGFTALHRSADHGHTGIVHELLSHGAYTEVVTDMEYTPLHLAVARGRTLTVKELIANGARPGALCAEGTARQLASKYGNQDTIELLVASPLDWVRYRMPSKLGLTANHTV